MLNTNKNTTDSRARHRINAKPLRRSELLSVIDEETVFCESATSRINVTYAIPSLRLGMKTYCGLVASESNATEIQQYEISSI